MPTPARYRTLRRAPEVWQGASARLETHAIFDTDLRPSCGSRDCFGSQLTGEKGWVDCYFSSRAARVLQSTERKYRSGNADSGRPSSCAYLDTLAQCPLS